MVRVRLHNSLYGNRFYIAGMSLACDIYNLLIIVVFNAMLQKLMLA